MSLEAQIAALNTNIEKLITLLANPIQVVPSTETPLRTEVQTGKASSGKPNPEKEPATGGKPSANDAPQAQNANAASIPYDDVKAAILKLSAAKGRDAAVAVLKQFGVAKGTELTPEQYPDALKAFSLALDTTDAAVA
ncbi:hypothetical protein [Dongia sp.]|uniref:hypothetical protein n=1 Tax=Dongia sp. TaxID=1977262 RepID=UPI0035AF2922